jgi:hypothetical protein
MNDEKLNLSKRLYRFVRYVLIGRHFYGLTAVFRVLPDFIVIGVGRSGTTSLFNYLEQHPSIVSSAYDEIGFFDDNFRLGLTWYRSMFPTIIKKFQTKKTTKFFMTYEVTPWYIRRPWTARRIKKLFPNIKLIAVLRNPVDRTYSHYHLSKRNNEKQDFETMIEEDMKNISKWRTKAKNDSYFLNEVQNSKLARGFYYEQLEQWFEIFDKDQILIIPGEMLGTQTKNTLQEVFRFLGLPEYEIKNTDKVNVAKYEKMKLETREKLVEFFRPYNKKLFGLLNRQFDWDK